MEFSKSKEFVQSQIIIHSLRGYIWVLLQTKIFSDELRSFNEQNSRLS